MDVLYGTDVSRNTLNDIIKASQDIIRIRRICKNQIPVKCSRQVNSLLAQNFYALQQSQQQPFVDSKYQLIQNINLDNRSPMKTKVDKNRNSQFACQRLSFDSKSFRKSSALKSRRDQCTASTNRKRLNAFSKTYDGSFLEERPWTQTQCRKKFCRTADASSRHKYFQLKEEKVETSIEDQVKRKQLKEKRTKQKVQHQKIQHALMRLSYQRRALQEEFQAAKIGQKKFSVSKNKPVNEITNYETQNGVVLTNRFKKPFRKTIQNIINLQYEERTRDRIFRRKSHRESEVQDSNRKKGEDEQTVRERFAMANSNYNNSGRRQLSLIPYVTINPGVSLSQNTIQASISRARPSEQLSREKFFSSIENKTFRSYSREGSPEKLDKKMMTIDVCQENRASKSTLNNETKDSLRKSILWGPKTSRDGHRIKLQKEDFLRQFAD